MDAGPLLEPFKVLAHDDHFWERTLDGLAVLAASSLGRVIVLPRPVSERVVVTDRFLTKPLRFLQSVDRYQVLCLSLSTVRLFEGNRDAFDEVELVSEVPRTLTDALGPELTESHQTVASYGGVGWGSHSMHHGHGAKKEEVDIDAERFFRMVDRARFEHYSRPLGLPLILAALPEHHHLFHQVSENPFLVATGLRVSADTLLPKELRSRAWGSDGAFVSIAARRAERGVPASPVERAR